EDYRDILDPKTFGDLMSATQLAETSAKGIARACDLLQSRVLDAAGKMQRSPVLGIAVVAVAITAGLLASGIVRVPFSPTSSTPTVSQRLSAASIVIPPPPTSTATNTATVVATATEIVRIVDAAAFIPTPTETPTETPSDPP